MSDSDTPVTSETGAQQAVPNRDSWLLDRYEPTVEQQDEWRAAGLPRDAEILAGFLQSNTSVFGVPDRKTIFQLAAMDKLAECGPPSALSDTPSWMELRIVEAVNSFPRFVLAAEPYGVGVSDVVEHSYNVRVQVISKAMFLYHIRVLSGSESESGGRLIFEGTEYPGPNYSGVVRVVRVTVYTPVYATWEVVSTTKCTHA